jgi:tRNA A58 N-methylase Trm61
MGHRVCPWWLGYVLASPLRRLLQDPVAIIKPYVREGMTVVEPGPGMGFFTLEMARRVGASGRVIAVDIQPRMIAGLKRRLGKAGLLDRADARLASSDSLGLQDLRGKVDFALAMAVVHEMPSANRFFAEVAQAMKPGATL